MPLDWFKYRGYRHLDLPVGEKFAGKAMDPDFVLKHSFLPLLHYTKSEKRYKKCPKTGKRTITSKDRPIKYASHRDACILSFYASEMNKLLDAHYAAAGLSDSVLAYRALGVSFQQVVHSIQTELVGVTKLQHCSEGSNERASECQTVEQHAKLTPI